MTRTRFDEWFTYLTFTTVGVGTLLPCNVIIMSLDYFALAYPGVPFAFIFPMLYDGVLLLLLVFSVLHGPCLSDRARMLGPLFFYFVGLAGIPVGVYALGAASLWITLGIIACLGGMAAVLTGTSFAVAARIDPRLVQAVMVGGGLAGIIEAVFRIGTKFLFTRDGEATVKSGVLYFIISDCVVLLGIVGLLVLNFGKRFSSTMVQLELDASESEDVSLLSQDAPRASSFVAFKRTLSELLETGQKIRNGVACIFVNYFITMSMFPGMTNRIPSTHESLGDWFMIITSSTCLVFDFLGRTVSSRFWTKIRIDVSTAARFLFYPVLFVALYRVIQSDIYVYCAIALFAFSHGFVTTVAAAEVEEKCNAKEKQTGSDLMTFALNAAILFASGFAYFLNDVIPEQ